MIYGVDISRHNSTEGNPFPMKAAARDGCKFVIAKASQGFCPVGVASRDYNFKDPWFDRHRKSARKSRLVFGAYHWLMRDSALTGTGRKQAEYFVRSLAPGVDQSLAAGRAAADGLLLAVDVERTAFGEGAEKAEIDGLPGWQALKSFITRFQQLLPGHPLLVYCNRASGPAITRHDVAGLGDTYLWYARWNDYDGRIKDVDASDIKGWGVGLGGFSGATMVQFTSDGNVGRRGRVDLDAYLGSITALRKLTRDLGAQPPVVKPRKRYWQGYDAAIGAAAQAVTALEVPAVDGRVGEAGRKAYDAGTAAAREHVIEFLGDAKERD